MRKTSLAREGIKQSRMTWRLFIDHPSNRSEVRARMQRRRASQSPFVALSCLPVILLVSARRIGVAVIR